MDGQKKGGSLFFSKVKTLTKKVLNLPLFELLRFNKSEVYGTGFKRYSSEHFILAVVGSYSRHAILIFKIN